MVDIRPLYDNSHDIESTNEIGVSFSESDCHKYKITASNTCDIEGLSTLQTVYLDAQFLRPDFRYVKESRQNRDGTTAVLSIRKEVTNKLEFIVNDYFLLYLTDLGMVDTLSIYPINPDGPEFEIIQDSWTIDPVGEDDQDTYAVQVQFRVKDSDLFTTACCEGQSIVSFEDPCDDGEGGGGDLPVDPCEDYAVEITYDGSSLSADVTGGPAAATITYVWYLDPGTGVFGQIATSQALNPVDSGTYRVVANRGVCQKAADYEFTGDCDDFTVEIIEKSGLLIASVNRFSTFVWYKDTGSGYVEIPSETTACLTPDESADYKVVATSSGCEEEDEVTVSVSVCAHTVSIARDGNVLESTVADNTGSPTYQWYADYGDGSGTVLISGATSPDLAITAPGCYELKVTADGCDKYAKFVVLDVCVGFNALIETSSPDGMGGVDLTAMAINPPGTVNYTWYQAIGGVWQQVGTGANINVTTTGNIRLEATSGDCTSEDMLFFCVDPGTMEKYQKFVGDDASLNWEVTAFTLPNPASYTVNEINAMLQVYRNGVKLEYATSPSDRTQYSIDFANNEIDLYTGWPLKSTEKLEVLEV